MKRIQRRTIALSLGAAAVAVSAATYVQAYTNPVLDEGFADPAVLRVGNTLYAYATGYSANSGSATPAIKMSKSTNFVSWTSTVTVMALPTWATGDTWAPHVVKDPNVANRYVMYFSAKANTANPNVPANADKCLGVAVASSPDGPFTPRPNPLRCGPGFVNIDPMAFYNVAQSKYYLYWGSASQPLKYQPLSTDLLGFEAGSTPTDFINPIPGDKYSNLIEGSWVIDRGDYRYLFMSGSNCCGPNDGYAVTVARRNIVTNGAWERYTGGDHGAILKMNATWAAPGHNATFTDGAGNHWIVYHARRANDATKRVLMIDRITWANNWPRIANDSPSTGAVASPTPY